ncbi:MAG: acetyl-CoA carboxylase biotin carboxyl carrier protein [Deltaproteobacteria bacterium]|nr:acetyl-CoA carboxylase biotin carboxyl carrier protein [Deltaproteobacteria bacterium]
MDIKDIKSLIKMVTETDITEFELETAEEKIRIQRGKAPEHVSYAIPQMVAAPQMVAPPILPPSQEKPLAAPAVAAESEKSQTITSPIVGTMYRSPAPDAPPYVEIGQIVEKGQVLCIVEAMKLMNEIEAEYRCKILKICKENAQPVEYGEALFLVEPQ